MKSDDKVYVAADKTSNFYKVTPEKHTELLNNNITKNYKKANEVVMDRINKGDKQFEIDDRVYALEKRECFITLMDHKDSFRNKVRNWKKQQAKSD